jgi:hypothetical protein
VAESVLRELSFEVAIEILPRLRFPRYVENELTQTFAEKAIQRFSSAESFWKAVTFRQKTALPPDERLALALRCLRVDPVKTLGVVSTFDLTTPNLQVPFARSVLYCSDVAAVCTLPWLSSLGTSDPAGAMELATLCLSHDPFHTAKHLDRFGLPLSPLIDKLLDEVGARYRWKILATVCDLPTLPENLRTALAESSSAHYPHETLRRLNIFKLPEGDTVINLLKHGLSLNPRAVASYVQKHASPFFREVAEHILWLYVSDMPWEAADVAIRVGINDQKLLWVIAQETFSRDASRSLRFIRESKMFSQETLCEAALQLSAIDPISVSRSIARFGNLPATTIKTIALRVAPADPERALTYLSTSHFSSEESRRELLISIATSHRGAALAAENLYNCHFSRPHDKFEVLTRCIAMNAESTIKCLSPASLSERMHAELVAHVTKGNEKEAKQLLHKVGVYSSKALEGLFGPDFIASFAPAPHSESATLARKAVASTPAKVAANIHKFSLPHERDRVEIAVACAKRAPRALTDNFLAFGIYSESGRKDVAAALLRTSAESVREAIKTCGVTSDADIQDLVAPLVNARPRMLGALKSLTQKPWSIQFFTRLFSQAITEERWSHAFDVGTMAAQSALGREPRQAESLKSFDVLLAEMKKLPNLSEQTAYQISLLERVRRAGTIPERAVLRAFTIFDDSSDAFVVEVLQQGGPSSGANIVEEMTRAYSRKKTIPESDRAIIREFISSGFRGFSRTTLTAAMKAFGKSPDEGRRLLASWKAISSAILQGKPLDRELEESPLFPNLIYAAYRPVDLRVASVAAQLPYIPDNSHHLTPWKYPANGYPIHLVELEEIRLKQDETIDLNSLRSAATPILSLSSAQSTCSHDEFVQILVKASQRGIDSINKAKLVKFLATHSRDIRAEGTNRELSSLLVDNVSPQHAAQAIDRMRSFFNVVYGDMLDLALRAYFDGGRLELRDQFKARIRNILKLPAEAEITLDQIRETVRGELDKVWRHERTLLNRESRKFTHQIGTMHAEYRMYLSKARSAFFGRAGAGLCTHDDLWSWNEASFLQMIMVDERKGSVVGNIQLHIFDAPDGKRSVLARINPTEKFLLTVSPKTLATEMLGSVETFARENNLETYLPGAHCHLHLLTNRESFAPLLKARYGERFMHDVKVSGWLEVNEIYRLMPPVLEGNTSSPQSSH